MGILTVLLEYVGWGLARTVSELAVLAGERKRRIRAKGRAESLSGCIAVGVVLVL